MTQGATTPVAGYRCALDLKNFGRFHRYQLPSHFRTGGAIAVARFGWGPYIGEHAICLNYWNAAPAR